MEESIKDEVHKSGKNRIVYTEHALDEMNEEEDVITKEEVRNVVFNGEIIENYPEDDRGHSCLMMNETGKKRPVHVVCSPKEEYLVIITTYVPNSRKWGSDFRIRK